MERRIYGIDPVQRMRPRGIGQGRDLSKVRQPDSEDTQSQGNRRKGCHRSGDSKINQNAATSCYDTLLRRDSLDHS